MNQSDKPQFTWQLTLRLIIHGNLKSNKQKKKKGPLNGFWKTRFRKDFEFFLRNCDFGEQS
jgi:hypothetical protein